MSPPRMLAVYDDDVSVLAQGAWLKELRSELQRRVGAKVRELREAQGLTQAQLGERIREVLVEFEPHRPDHFWTQVTAVSRLERGVLTINLEMVEILARALTVDPLLILDPAFKRKPRSTEEIAVVREEDAKRLFGKAYDYFAAVHERFADNPDGSRAIEAVVALSDHHPDQLRLLTELIEYTLRREVAADEHDAWVVPRAVDAIVAIRWQAALPKKSS